jgi:hypothetical protein
MQIMNSYQGLHTNMQQTQPKIISGLWYAGLWRRVTLQLATKTLVTTKRLESVLSECIAYFWNERILKMWTRCRCMLGSFTAWYIDRGATLPVLLLSNPFCTQHVVREPETCFASHSVNASRCNFPQRKSYQKEIRSVKWVITSV